MNKVMVTINGEEYPMVGEKSEQHMRKVARYVDKEMSKITEANPRLSLSVGAILAAVNIADDFFECSDAYEELFNENEELKKKATEPNAELQLELQKLKLELENKAKEELDNKAKVEELSKLVEEQKSQIANLSTQTACTNEEVDNYKLRIEELTTESEQANERATIAESLSSEFQNKAYSLQLKFTELENEVKYLRATR